ncbi:36278_t:CDS:2, partial [Racocetra persica]
VDKTKLTFTNLPEYAKIIPKGVHGYANLNSLTNEGKTKLEILNISDENLEGELDLSDFINLKELNCSNNKLISLNLIPCTNLEELVLANNNFTGSLDYLSNLQQLKRLDISDTNINEVNLDKLPKSLENIEYSAYQRLNCQLTYIVPELRRYEHEDIKNLTGPEVIEKFIRQQQLKEGTDGGFSQIYKAECREIKKYDKDYSENVVLKSLNNSQNITLEFLTEIANTKLVRGGLLININYMAKKIEITFGPLEHPYRCANCLSRLGPGGANTPQTIYLVIWSIDTTSIVGDKRLDYFPSLPGKMTLFPNEDSQEKKFCQLFDQEIFKTAEEYQKAEDKLTLIQLREELEKGVGEIDNNLIEEKPKLTSQL